MLHALTMGASLGYTGGKPGELPPGVFLACPPGPAPVVRGGTHMAKIVLVCPFCQKKLETDAGNVGRDGQCPACEKVFEITATEPAGALTAVGAGAREYEYQDMGALVAVGAVGVALLLLVASTFTSWTPSYGKLAAHLAGVKTAVLAVSLACCAFLVFSAAGGKSLMPAVIVSGAWGMVVIVWTWGVWFVVHGAVQQVAEAVRRDFALNAGLFLTLGAAVLVVLAAVYVYVQVKADTTYDRLGVLMVVADLVAVILALLAVGLNVRPAVGKLVQTVEPAEERAPAGPAGPPAGRTPPVERERPIPPPEEGGPQQRTERRPPRDETAPAEGAVPFIPAVPEEELE